MKHTFSLRLRIGLSIANACITASTPAYGDPITVAVFGATFAATLGGAIVTAVITFAITSIASLIVTKLFAPKQNAQDRQASVLQISIGEGPREALFGEVATGGSFADGFNYGGTDGTDWEVLIIPVADHRCDSLTGYYVGDVYVPFTADGPVAGYSGQLEVYWRDGAEDQVMPAIVTSHGGWAPSDNLAGVATVIVAYKADKPDAKTPIWTGGRPSFLWVVKGALLYLPRRDSSIGGSGPHRWNDPSTREWSDNPIDCRYNWVRGIYACDRIDQPGMLLVGRGLSAIEAPPEDSFAFANTCDEPVALKAGGTEPRYRCNLVVRSNEDYISTEETFAACCAGIIVQRQGGVQVEPGSARSVVEEITDDDFIVGESLTFNAFKSDTQRINSVVPRYVEPSQRWADHAAPLRRNLADLATDGGPREESLSLIAVTSNTQAQRCGEIRRRLARMERTASGTLGPRFAHLEEGDWIAWTSKRHLRGQRVVFRIASYSLAASWRNSISIEEIAAWAYSWNPSVDELTPGAVAEQQSAPTPSAPSGEDWSVAGASLSSTGGSIPALVISGASGNPYASGIIFEYRSAGTDEWIGTDLAAPGTTRREISSVRPGEAYEAGVSYVIAGTPTERLVLGPVTAGDLTTAGSVQMAISNSFFVGDLPLAAEDGTITIASGYRRYSDGHADVAVTGATIASALAAGETTSIAYDDPDRVGGAVSFTLYANDLEAHTSPDHPGRHYVGYVVIPTAGSPPASGGGTSFPGGGRPCVTIDTPIMMADGTTKPAGEIAVGDLLWTRHEVGFGWGAYPVEAVAIVESDDVWEAEIGGRQLHATGDHQIYTGGWVAMRDIGHAIGSGRVVKMTVTSAHTYVSNGILSHNLKQFENTP